MALTPQQHVPVLLPEVLRTLAPGRPGVYVDATFGRGGHAQALLAQLPAQARLLVLDRDLQAVAAARQLAEQDARLLVRHAAFADLAEVLQALQIEQVQGVLMDLGVSSPQLDSAERGFSFRLSGPLDMRMDASQATTAASWLQEASEKEIAEVIFRFGEERFARRIAQRIVQARPLTTTAELAELVKQAVPARFHGGKHPATRTFQAIRMAINEEDSQLRAGLDAAFAALAVSGRLAVISFHSLEDRIVKQTFRHLSQPAPVPRRVPLRGESAQPPGKLIGGAQRPGAEELAVNPRARSATLRVIEKINGNPQAGAVA
ncbi:MAG: 16S rRNA (cytosine(1402)-N(4))-methyltransferase RsmH [Pseudomonadota bacterium]